MWNWQINTFTMKEWDSCTCFCAFNRVILKQKLLQLVLRKKQAPLKEQRFNGFPQINIHFKFYRPLVIMDSCNKCCEIKAVSLTYRSLQVFPWKNDITIEKMDGRNWCRQITDFFQYTPPWNQCGRNMAGGNKNI